MDRSHLYQGRTSHKEKEIPCIFIFKYMDVEDGGNNYSKPHSAWYKTRRHIYNQEIYSHNHQDYMLITVKRVGDSY